MLQHPVSLEAIFLTLLLYLGWGCLAGGAGWERLADGWDSVEMGRRACLECHQQPVPLSVPLAVPAAPRGTATALLTAFPQAPTNPCAHVPPARS